MSVSTEILARKYLNPVAGTPISVDFPVFEDGHVRVLYGLAGNEAVLDTDFTVTLNLPDYEDFTVTPTASLRTKIDAMIAADATESDQIVVRRDMPMLTDMTPTLARLREQIALEFDRTALRLQQLQEINDRSLQVAETDVSGSSNVLPPMSANKSIKRNATNDGWVETTYDPDEAQTDAQAAQAAAEAAQTAAETAQSAAETAQAAAEAALDSFDDRYLGAKASAPTLDNDGNPLQDGALYYNTNVDIMYVYDLATTTWLDVGSITASSTTEFTNKTLDSDTNTIGADHIHIRVRNTSGGTLTAGTVVKATGYSSGQDRIEISATTATNDIAFGALAEDLDNNTNGLAVNTGVINNVDTSSFSVGDKLYSDGAGGFTTTKPAAPYQTCGFVLRSSAVNGRLFVEFTDQVGTDKDSKNTFTKTQTFSKGADVASAATLTLGDDGNYFDVTGTTSITAIASKGVGTQVKLHFDGAVTLTHSAADLVMPGGVDYTTAAGDELEFVEYASGDWRCTNISSSGANVLSDRFVSAEQTYTTSSTITVAHGLSGKPKDARMVLVCKTANLGYPVGAEVVMQTNIDSSTSRGFALHWDATNVYVECGSGTYDLINRGTYSEQTMTAASWKIRIEAEY